tara:strand:+ start:976 stop:1182 length:207 start_codon:yes stop_codon:yes gene_type:complete
MPEQIDPTPDEIKERAKEIRKNWTDEIREIRSVYRRRVPMLKRFRYSVLESRFIALDSTLGSRFVEES